MSTVFLELFFDVKSPWKKMRDAADLRQADVAREIGISKAALSRLEKHNHGLPVVRKLVLEFYSKRGIKPEMEMTGTLTAPPRNGTSPLTAQIDGAIAELSAMRERLNSPGSTLPGLLALAEALKQIPAADPGARPKESGAREDSDGPPVDGPKA